MTLLFYLKPHYASGIGGGGEAAWWPGKDEDLFPETKGHAGPEKKKSKKPRRSRRKKDEEELLLLGEI